MAIVVALVSGLLFGLGLMISGLMNPAKVLNFLDVAGTWDPSLAFTMGAAIPVAAIGFRLACRAETPLYGCACEPPDKDGIDATLLSGAAIFGIGWGLVGFCPGPALAALSTGSSSCRGFHENQSSESGFRIVGRSSVRDLSESDCASSTHAMS